MRKFFNGGSAVGSLIESCPLMNWLNINFCAS
jgi:hypothetical protein